MLDKAYLIMLCRSLIIVLISDHLTGLGLRGVSTLLLMFLTVSHFISCHFCFVKIPTDYLVHRRHTL